jgi:F-type H+-transporting ATPase subunit delta
MTMRGASSEALVALVDQLEQGLSSADAAQVGHDLFAIAAVLRSEAGLRRVATDVSTDAEAKAGLLRGIFDGKVAPLALDVVVEAVRRRWTASRDLADALEHLGVVTLVRSAGSGDAARLADELFVVGQLVNDNPELRSALSDPARAAEDKRALLRGLLGGKALPATVSLAEQALAGSYRSVDVAIAEFQKVAAAVYDEQVAKVRTARALSEADRDRLQQALTRQYGREVHLNVVLEPGLVGGLRIEIGDDVIDGSVSARLDEARRKLAG